MTVREDRPAGALRGVLATVAIGVAVVAGLALVGSFFLDPSPGAAGGPGGVPGTNMGSTGGSGAGGGGTGQGDGGSGTGADGDGASAVDCRVVRAALGTIAAVAAVLTGLFAVLAVVRGRARGGSFMETAWGPTCLALGSITLVLLVALAFVSLGCGAETAGEVSSGPQGSAGGGGPGGSEGTGDTEVPPPPRLPDWGLILLILAGVVALALLVYAIVRWRRGGGDGAADEAGTDVHAREHRALRRILDRGDLQSQEAVVAAYRTFLAWADGRGLPRASEDTPMEHAQRVAGRFRFPPDEMRAFVAAYQVARLSEREPTAGEREHALRFSSSLSDRGGTS